MGRSRGAIRAARGAVSRRPSRALKRRCFPAMTRVPAPGARALDHDVAPAVSAVGRALPRHHLDQEQLIGALRGLWAEKHFNVERLEGLHRAVQVSGRYLALPLEAYAGLDTFQKSNDAFIEVAQDLGAQAMQDGLARAGLVPRDVDHVFFVTVTGIATPSIEARLVNRLGLKPSVKRTPIFGIGGVGGAARPRPR